MSNIVCTDNSLLDMKEFNADILTMSYNALMEHMYELLGKFGYTVAYNGNFLYAKPKEKSQFMLIAHTDTCVVPTYISVSKMIVSGTTGVNGDDRAGVALIAALIQAGNKPYILLCNGEESGGTGARTAAKQLTPPECVKLLVELDRAGTNNFVCYHNCSPSLIAYMQLFKLSMQQGSFSDISILAPIWNLPAVNVATGYYNQHSSQEYISFQDWYSSFISVGSMLKSYVPADIIFERQSCNWQYDFSHVSADTIPQYVNHNCQYDFLVSVDELAQNDPFTDWYELIELAASKHLNIQALLQQHLADILLTLC